MSILTNENTSTQQARNEALLAATTDVGQTFTSSINSLNVDINRDASLTTEQVLALQALGIESARTAIKAVGELALLKEVDHLGGGLDLIPALLLSLSVLDGEARDFTIENAHTSIGYYSALASLGYITPERVVSAFRRSLDIAGHVSWVPGGTQLNGGRLGVMIPTAVGQALGKKARHGNDAWVICHCGDAGWISGQALNGFIGASAHGAPTTFVMHRNGIQLSDTTAHILDMDPRPIVEALGIKVLEVSSVHDAQALYSAYREAHALAKEGKPSLVYPVGYSSENGETLSTFADRYGIASDTQAFAESNGVTMDTAIWTPGALMSFRDVPSMLECLFYVNNLPGGKGHHDGHMMGRDVEALLENPMLQLSSEEATALEGLRAGEKQSVVTNARPAPGSSNLPLPDDVAAQVKLPEAGTSTSARAGVQAAYEAIAKTFPNDFYIIDCDLAPSTKVDKARAILDQDHQFEMSIEEQVSAIMANGLAMSSHDPQLVVFATFAAFFEGIAREGFEMWRYQRNLNGINEGLNVTYHLSHVGACTGRDHFSGWSLDWINLAIGYLPYLHRFYAPADARSAFIATRDLAAHYGAHILAIPRDNLPILTQQGSDEALWNPNTPWEAITTYRKHDGAKKAVLALGAPAFLAEQASDHLTAHGTPTDVYIVNGLPVAEGALAKLAECYSDGIVTIEDGIIADEATGLRGFAGLVSSATRNIACPLKHIGITDPRIAPSEGHMEVWAHFGITADAIVHAVESC